MSDNNLPIHMASVPALHKAKYSDSVEGLGGLGTFKTVIYNTT